MKGIMLCGILCIWIVTLHIDIHIGEIHEQIKNIGTTTNIVICVEMEDAKDLDSLEEILMEHQ